MSYSFISPAGEIVRTRTVKEFASISGMTYGSAKNLACGWRARNNGWCSTHKRAKKQRARFMTELVNIRTGARAILGCSVHHFAREQGLSIGRLSRLVVGNRIRYKDWMLAQTYDQIYEPAPDSIL